jgi:Tetracyclin repressor-like, C-terminal domain
VIKHYDFAGSHWRETKGYEAYQVGADMIREAGMEAAADGYADTQIWGTPEQIVQKYRHRFEVFGDHQPNIAPSFAGLPFDKVRASLELFGEKVVPELHKMGVQAAVACRAHVLHIGANRDAWWVAARELRALSPEELDRVQVYRRRYQHRIAQHLADGARAGELDCDDPRLTSLALLDMINGLNEWFDPAGRLTIEEIAERCSELAVRQLTP